MFRTNQGHKVTQPSFETRPCWSTNYRHWYYFNFYVCPSFRLLPLSVILPVKKIATISASECLSTVMIFLYILINFFYLLDSSIFFSILGTSDLGHSSCVTKQFVTMGKPTARFEFFFVLAPVRYAQKNSIWKIRRHKISILEKNPWKNRGKFLFYSWNRQ